MGLKTLPKFVEAELEYPYMTKVVTDEDGNEKTVAETIVYKFPRLRKRDVEVDANERRTGNGFKYTSAVRLSKIVEDITGWESYGFEPKGADEALGVFRQRIVTFFDNDEMQEYAEHALLARIQGAYPQSTFRSSSPGSLVQLGSRREPGPGASLSDLHPPGQGSPE